MKTITDANILDPLYEISLFDALPPNELELVCTYLHLVSFQQGETIFKEGDEGEFASFVVSGEIEVLKESEDRLVSIAKIKRGRSVGEMAIIDGAPRSATAKAVKRGQMIVLYRDRFTELLLNQPKIGVSLLQRIARMLSLNLRKTSALYVEALSELSG